jgi:hypothetical protein
LLCDTELPGSVTTVRLSSHDGTVIQTSGHGTTTVSDGNITDVHGNQTITDIHGTGNTSAIDNSSTLTHTSTIDNSEHDSSVHSSSIVDTSVHDSSAHDSSIHDTSLHDNSIHETTHTDTGLDAHLGFGGEPGLALSFFFGDEFGALAAFLGDAVAPILLAGLLAARHHHTAVGHRIVEHWHQ